MNKAAWSEAKSRFDFAAGEDLHLRSRAGVRRGPFPVILHGRLATLASDARDKINRRERRTGTEDGPDSERPVCPAIDSRLKPV